jgi:hypothetical protein
MCNTHWARDVLYKGTEMTNCQPNIVKASCSMLAMGNTELARHERHERRDDHFLVLAKAFLSRHGMFSAQ